ncbi:MAG: 3-deoxy-7-phosphoheptulonate synthase, partial [Enterobacterales bacterium]
MFYQNDDNRIHKIKELLPPVALMERFPVSQNASETVYFSREAIHQLVQDESDRLLVII